MKAAAKGTAVISNEPIIRSVNVAKGILCCKSTSKKNLDKHIHLCCYAPYVEPDEFERLKWLSSGRIGDFLFNHAGHIVKKITNLRNKLKASYGGIPVSLMWAVDATGVGSVLVSMLETAMPEETIFSVYMTAGQSERLDQYDVHIGKQQLVSALVGSLNSGTLHLPRDASDLVDELQNYEVRVSAAGRDQFGAFKTGAYDDDVTALTLLLWSCQNWGMRSDKLIW